MIGDSHDEAHTNRQPSKLHRANQFLKSPLTNSVEKDYKNALKELGRLRHDAKPNLIERRISKNNDSSNITQQAANISYITN